MHNLDKLEQLSGTDHPTNICLFKINNRNTKKRCEIYSKLTIKTPDVVLVFLLLTLNVFPKFF